MALCWYIHSLSSVKMMGLEISVDLTVGLFYPHCLLLSNKSMFDFTDFSCVTLTVWIRHTVPLLNA